MRCLRAATGAAALACLVSGCGGGEPAAATGLDEIPAPTRRLQESERFNDPAFKKMMEQGGPKSWSPEMMKRTPGGGAN
ncbi:hypothetical protein [Tautonia plasticadhaerens]|uniref:Lipoprotein n=1 Tax=Tautonia plasticadhaerens TaxID=2527974 RepID=A0A518HA85_9BACT|nr:hypothetical protein [Tautonia plasticadhaerens]QDV37760.1 hypothetical protein ElP_57060 [Tautonia plasticadhaerens]